MSEKKQRLEVYYNLHKKVWSVRNKGKVIDHCTSISLVNPSFDVQPAGNERVKRTGVKNVHAFVRGNKKKGEAFLCTDDWREVTYNPKKHDSFVLRETGEPVSKADAVIMESGTLHIKGGSLKPSVLALNPR
jgi:hypothetical protein